MTLPSDGPVASRLDIMVLGIVCIPPPSTIGVLPAAGTHQPFAREAIESAPYGAVFCVGDRIDEVNPGRNLDRVERPRFLPKQRQHFVFDPAPRSHVPIKEMPHRLGRGAGQGLLETRQVAQRGLRDHDANPRVDRRRVTSLGHRPLRAARDRPHAIS
jgi:hypothetical protein